MSSISWIASKSIIKEKDEEVKKAKFGWSISKTDRAFGMSKGLGLGAKQGKDANGLPPIDKPLSKPLAPLNHDGAIQKLDTLSKAPKDTVSIIEEQNWKMGKISSDKMTWTQRPSIPVIRKNTVKRNGTSNTSFSNRKDVQSANEGERTFCESDGQN